MGEVGEAFLRAGQVIGEAGYRSRLLEAEEQKQSLKAQQDSRLQQLREIQAQEAGQKWGPGAAAAVLAGDPLTPWTKRAGGGVGGGGASMAGEQTTGVTLPKKIMVPADFDKLANQYQQQFQSLVVKLNQEKDPNKKQQINQQLDLLQQSQKFMMPEKFTTALKEEIFNEKPSKEGKRMFDWMQKYQDLEPAKMDLTDSAFLNNIKNEYKLGDSKIDELENLSTWMKTPLRNAKIDTAKLINNSKGIPSVQGLQVMAAYGLASNENLDEGDLVNMTKMSSNDLMNTIINDNQTGFGPATKGIAYQIFKLKKANELIGGLTKQPKSETIEESTVEPSLMTKARSKFAYPK